MVDYLAILYHVYPEDTPLRRLLLRHSTQVRDKALSLLDTPACQTLKMDRELVEAGAMLHDIGIGACHAPGILCTGTEPYLAHGLVGGRILRDYGQEHGLDLEPYARICERHTGSGITAEEVIAEGLPIPPADYMPETLEEKLVCYADKFFSKSGNGAEKSFARARHGLERFGEGPCRRFDELKALFEGTMAD